MNRTAAWIFIVCLALVICSSFTVTAQNNPVIETGAPQSNNTLPSGGTLGSNSGVNPMGNPGTITNSSANSSSINNTLSAHPNIEPGTFLTSAPEGTVTTTTITTGNVTQQTSTVNVPGGGTIASGVRDSAGATVKNNASVRDNEIKEPARDITIKEPAREVTIKEPVKVKVAKVAKANTKKDDVIVPKPRTIPAYTPVRGNFVSEQTLSNIKTKYGSAVYDIRTVKMTSTKRIAYIVRIVDEEGKLRSELFYDDNK